MTGARPDLAAVAELCRPRGIFVLVDAAQSLGIVDTDCHRLGIDGLVGATQKGLLSMYGVGVFYCRREWLDRLDPPFLSVPGVSREGLHESDLGDVTRYRVRDSAAKFETGNHNFAGIFALSAALTFYDSYPLEVVEGHVRDLATRLIDGLHRAGVPVVTPADEEHRAGIVACEPPDVAAVHRHLTAQGVQVSVRRGRLRASLHLYNGGEDVDRLLSGIADGIRSATR
jgi:selenocysteine lyase/cysteine desulfurase